MNSRQRVRTSLRHQQPDKVPVDFGGHRSSGIAAVAYAKLKKSLGITSGNIYIYDMIQQLAIVEPEVLDALGSDVIELGRGFMLNDSEWKDWVLPDGTPCKIPGFIKVEKRGEDSYLLSDDNLDLGVQKGDCLYFEQIHWPWLEKNPDEQDFTDLEEAFGHSMWTNVPSPGANIPLDEEGCKELAEGARKLRESTDRAIIGLFGGSFFELPQFMYRIDNYLTHMLLYPEACDRLSQKLYEYYLPRLERWLEAVGPYIDVIMFGDDFGGQDGLLISEEMYRRFIKPYHTKLWTRIKEIAPDITIQIHSCGSIESLLDDLIEAGLDAANPVQISCKNMDPAHLKKTYGDRFTFWGGGIDTQNTLPFANPEQVKESVHGLLDIWAPKGGFVFQQVHNIQADIPSENIIAMFEAVKEWKYKT